MATSKKPVPAKAKASNKPTGKEVAKTSGKALAPSALAEAFAHDSGAGFQGMQASDLAMPFLSILQSGSPQLKRKNDKYIDGAEEGDIINTASLELFSGDDGVLVVPCAYKMFLNEWVPRDNGGGLVAVHDRDSDILSTCERDDKGRYVTPKGNHIIQTATFYVLVEREEGEWERAVLPMTSTQLKKSRRWNTMMQSLMLEHQGRRFKAPMFSHMYRLTTIDERNDQGEWKGWVITNEGPIRDAALYQAAKDFHSMVADDLVNTDFSKMDGQAADEDDETSY